MLLDEVIRPMLQSWYWFGFTIFMVFFSIQYSSIHSIFSWVEFSYGLQLNFYLTVIFCLKILDTQILTSCEGSHKQSSNIIKMSIVIIKVSYRVKSGVFHLFGEGFVTNSHLKSILHN